MSMDPSVQPPASPIKLLSFDNDSNPPISVRTLPAFERPLQTNVREIALLEKTPWVRTLGKLTMDVTTQIALPNKPKDEAPRAPNRAKTPIKPPSDMVIFKDRLLYLLQPPLENLFANKQIELPFQPYPYQIKGI